MDGKAKSALIFPHKLLAESKVQMILKAVIFLDHQKILIFEFGDNNVLNKKEFLSKADLNDIDYEVAVTDSSGKKLNWYREFFRNLNPDPFGTNK